MKKLTVAALAVAIGTAHGLYAHEPRLDFVRLAHLSVSGYIRNNLLYKL